MIDRDGAIVIALKFSTDNPLRKPIAGVVDVFSMDHGETWTVQLLERNEPCVDGEWIITSTQQVHVIMVNARTGRANWCVGL